MSKGFSWLIFAPSVVLLVIPVVAHAQRIPDIAIWSVGAGLLAPIIAIPVKIGIARLFRAEIGHAKLWNLCAAEWFLWFPCGFILFRVAGTAFILIIPIVFSALLHRKSMTAPTDWARNLIGSILTLPTPALALLLFLGVLRA